MGCAEFYLDDYVTIISKANHYVIIPPLLEILILDTQKRCALNGSYLDIKHLLSLHLAWFHKKYTSLVALMKRHHAGKVSPK